MSIEPVTLRPTALLHQEGVLALVALVGLALTAKGPLGSLIPRQGWGPAVGVGVAVGVALTGLAAVLLFIPAIKALDRWQSAMVRGWTPGDAVAVAVFSAVAEEALMRALLQPIIGIVAAALIFAVLHVVPDCRLWAWPVIAFGYGLVFGVLFLHWGFPAAATAHLVVNLVSLLRMRRSAGGETTLTDL